MHVKDHSFIETMDKLVPVCCFVVPEWGLNVVRNRGAAGRVRTSAPGKQDSGFPPLSPICCSCDIAQFSVLPPISQSNAVLLPLTTLFLV